MNLHARLFERLKSVGPVRVGLIGAGKFGSMFLAQVPHIRGIEVWAIADLDVERAKAACRSVGWPDRQVEATRFFESGLELCSEIQVDVIIEATGNPAAGLAHARAAFAEHRHVVMVNVEADVLVGPLLAQEAREAGVVYSMAYGDQPALIAEMVDWARSIGLEVIAAGKGTKYLPIYHTSTPLTVWDYYGLTAAQAEAAGMNPQMFNSFLDGTKSAIEMAAVANATGLAVPVDGLHFPPAETHELAQFLRPRAEGGVLETAGQVEVVSSLARDGRELASDLRWGVYVVFKAPNPYTQACFRQYGLVTDPSGQYSALYRPYHLIGLELSISVLSAVLRGEPTGETRAFNGDAVAVAKRDLRAGERLDGEGGATVWGKLVPAERSLSEGLLPIGLAHDVTLARDIPSGTSVGRDCVTLPDNEATRARRDMEAIFANRLDRAIG